MFDIFPIEQPIEHTLFLCHASSSKRPLFLFDSLSQSFSFSLYHLCMMPGDTIETLLEEKWTELNDDIT